MNTCRCNNTPGLIIGYKGNEPIRCMICGKKILVKSFNVPETVALAFNEWNKKYKALHDDWMSDKTINRKSGQVLKDDLSEINLEGITLSQALTKERETYFLLFNDNALGEVTVPDLCPYCGSHGRNADFPTPPAEIPA